jgi:hypothetical protein
MRRQRSVSFYAETEDEYIEEYDRRKSISERRRYRPRSYIHKNEQSSDIQTNNNYNKKFFQSYDDLELDQLGVNSTFQIAQIENEESEDNEGHLIQKINNINLSFKQNNNNSFFSNLAPFTKNIIGPLESTFKPNMDDAASGTQNDNYNLNFSSSNNKIDNLNKDKREKIDQEINDSNNNEDDYDNLGGIGGGSYQMRYNNIKVDDDSLPVKRERINSLIENNCENENISFLDNININELNNSIQNDNITNNIQITNYKVQKDFESDSPRKNNLNDNISFSHKTNNFERAKTMQDSDKSKTMADFDKSDDKKMRRYTFDINTFFPDNNYHKEGEEIDKPSNKTLQNFICNNEFLSKNIDFVDEHLKFLITGSDIKSKHLFLNQLLREKSNYEDNESFNICKKVIKLLGDYIKLELYEEDCSLCYSHMLNTYIDVSDGVILIINMNIPKSAKYIYDIIEKLKYKLNKDKRHFNAILLCFEIIIVKDLKNVDINKEEKNSINNNNINESKDIINKIEKEFELKPNYITFYSNNKDNYLKNDKFELVINKFLSLAYLKKERKRRKNSLNKNVKKHKRGITGL